MPVDKPTAFDLTDRQIKAPFADAEGENAGREGLGLWLKREVDNAVDLRIENIEQCLYGWQLYEQKRLRQENTPWPDAADLTSPIAQEAVDSIQARVMATIYSDNVWTVEGYGESASKAPFVEEFHQRTQEEERLQTYLDDVIQTALVEGVGTLEVSEEVKLVREKRVVNAKIMSDPMTGGTVINEDGTPEIEYDEDGYPVVENDPNAMAQEVEYDKWEPTRIGPSYQVLPYADFMVLPQHARHRDEIWGYAKRFWRRVPELKDMAKKGVYDKKAVEEIGESDERSGSYANQYGQTYQATVIDQKGPTAQKELWEIQFLADLDGDGERWWTATLHRDSGMLLRLKRDDRVTRYIRFNPFPKANNLDRGYSLITDKLITVIEEDTSVRNMRADKAALSVSRPIKRRMGSPWDPYEQPFGPRAVIDVASMDEVQEMNLGDVPPSINIWAQSVRADADRLIGQNDTALGQAAKSGTTLGEIRLRAGYAEVRMDLLIKRFKEPMEELAIARHNIWKRTLASKERGWRMPQSMVMGLEARGMDFTGTGNNPAISAQMLDGEFWFKPQASVESADKNVQRALLAQILPVIAKLMQTHPMYQQIFGSPQAVKSIAEQIVRVFAWPDRHSFLGPWVSEQLDMTAAMNSPQMQMIMQAMQGAGGMMAPEGAGGPAGPSMGPTGGMNGPNPGQGMGPRLPGDNMGIPGGRGPL